MAKLSHCLICLPLLAVGACAITGDPPHLAATECKVTIAQPGTIREAPPQRTSELDRQLAISRLRMLNSSGAPGLVEDALRDCYR